MNSANEPGGQVHVSLPAGTELVDCGNAFLADSTKFPARKGRDRGMLQALLPLRDEELLPLETIGESGFGNPAAGLTGLDAWFTLVCWAYTARAVWRDSYKITEGCAAHRRWFFSLGKACL
jgi:hypothetical protein